jgi:hypothetical protein
MPKLIKLIRKLLSIMLREEKEVMKLGLIT